MQLWTGVTLVDAPRAVQDVPQEKLLAPLQTLRQDEGDVHADLAGSTAQIQSD